jgi:hypothetical protein
MLMPMVNLVMVSSKKEICKDDFSQIRILIKDRELKGEIQIEKIKKRENL